MTLMSFQLTKVQYSLYFVKLFQFKKVLFLFKCNSFLLQKLGLFCPLLEVFYNKKFLKI